MDVPEYGSVDAVFVEQRLECLLTGLANVAATARRVPGAVPGDNDPGSDAPVNRSKVRLQPFELLTVRANRTTVQICARAVFGIGIARFRV